MLKAAAAKGFSIDWGAFGIVLITSLAAAVVIVVFFSIALRLLAGTSAARESGGVGGASDGVGGSQAVHRSPLTWAAAIACIGLCGAVVVYGLYLVIPIFH